MLTFSSSSVMMSILFSNILLIILYFIFRDSRIMMEIGCKLLALFIGITVLRFLFPFEIPCSTNILIPERLSHILILCFKNTLVNIGCFHLSGFHILLIIWAIGSCIAMLRFLLACRAFHEMIKTNGADISEEEPYHSLLEGICIKHDKKNCFHIIRLSGIASPMITGIRKPYILIPENFGMKEQDLYYILNHETAHFFHQDLLLRFFSELLGILYWWNPFMILLKRQITTMLELRIDLQITESPDPQERLNYLDCLLNAAKAGISAPAIPAISLCSAGESLLTQRFSIIMNSQKKKTCRKKQVLLSLFMAGLYFFSIFFIFEPSGSLPSEDGIFTVTPEDSYLVENPDGTYDFYHDEIYQSTISRIDETLLDLPVYKKGELQ